MLSKYLPALSKLLIILMVAAGAITFWYINTLPDRLDAQQTLVIGPDRFAPASEAALRVIVQEAGGGGRPISQARVKVSLEDENQTLSLFEGATDASGSLPLSFQIPAGAEGDYQLVVETESASGVDRLTRPVTVARDFRLLLASDKPLYQPGQTIHMRALALDRLTLTPARGATVDFLVEDAKGNKVFRRSVTASDFGIAAVDFTLADRVNQGDYKLSVTLGNTTSEKTVEVKPYLLPKFNLALSTDRNFYTPGQQVEGSLQADYFFGKPVANGQVRLAGLVYDVERVEWVQLSGQTDAQGRYTFSFNLPDYLVGTGLDSQQAQFALEVTVIDQTDHAEQTSLLLPVAAQPIIIEAVAESGTVRPGVENIIYLLTAYPDGAPAQADLEIGGAQLPTQNLATNAYGLAELRVTPGQEGLELAVLARDERGFSASRTFSFQADYGYDHVLLRADRAAYLVGETMNLTALTPVDTGSIYLDIVKEGQTLSTRAAPVEAGRASFAIDLSPDLYGTLELHAYKVLLDGTIVRDSRLVVVDEPRDLAISVSADKESYRPGETATLNFETTTQAGGEPVQTALGLAVVDESVFALEQQDPGFAKLYFLLQAELMEPFYQIKDFELPAALPPDRPELRQAQDTSAQAAWAGASTAGLPLQANSRTEKLAAAQQARQAGLLNLSLAAILAMSLIPLLMAVLVFRALRRAGQIRPALWGLVRISGMIALIFIALCGLFYGLTDFFWRWGWYYYDLQETLLIGLAGFFALALLGLAIYSWGSSDETGKFLALLSAAWIACFVLFFMAVDEGAAPDELLVIPLLLTFMLLPVIYLLYGQKLWAEARLIPGWLLIAMGGVASLLACLIFLALGMSLTMGMGGMALGPEPVFMEAAAMPTAMEAPALAGSELEADSTPVQNRATGGEPPRLRQFFPETLYWNPEVVTDQAGQASLEIPLADSITTWRLTALASSQDGRLGFTTQGLRVFQDFFIDLDLPLNLTQGDEISIPVGVFNYLPQPQQVRLVVEPEPWFELLGQSEQTLTIAANEIEVVYFPIRVTAFGRQGFQVTAWGDKMSDAIRRQVQVLPNGQEIRLTESNWLRENTELSLNIPPDIVPRTAQVEVKIYSGVLAQVVEGLEKILRLPHG